jgi:N-formylglutamate amidohydrolase
VTVQTRAAPTIEPGPDHPLLAPAAAELPAPAEVVAGVVEVFAAAEPAAPLVLDSPHSGTLYPPEFDMVCDFPRLREAEDTYVDLLVSAAPRLGAPLVRALFPRSFIDVNRAADDIDAALVDGVWPGPTAPSEKSRLGMGLVRRLSKPGEPIYDRHLTVAEIAGRIDEYWRPYHAALDRTLDAVQARFGRVFYLDCHSMPAVANAMASDPGHARADFVLGDRDGTTCDPGLRDRIGAILAGFGYDVAINDPYKGVELVRRHGRPAEGRQALQLEINRRLYMDERTLAPHDGFPRLRRHLTALIEHLVKEV